MEKVRFVEASLKEPVVAVSHVPPVALTLVELVALVDVPVMVAVVLNAPWMEQVGRRRDEGTCASWKNACRTNSWLVLAIHRPLRRHGRANIDKLREGFCTVANPKR